MKIKRTLAALLAATMIMGMTSCSLFDKEEDDDEDTKTSVSDKEDKDEDKEETKERRVNG
ncbi:MAG: hypothetical protein ACI4JW_10395 [Oscillospiraceae bacterium]